MQEAWAELSPQHSTSLRFNTHLGTKEWGLVHSWWYTWTWKHKSWPSNVLLDKPRLVPHVNLEYKCNRMHCSGISSWEINITKDELSSVKFSGSVMSDSLWPHEPPGLPVHHQLPESTQTYVHCVGDAIQPTHPLLSPSPPALSLSQHQGLFQWVSSSHQVAKVFWSFSFNISPSNEHLGLISFRMDCLDLLAVQGILKSLLQHRNSEASILRHSVFFIVQVSHPYMTTGKTIAFTRRTFVGKVMSLLFNMLSRLVIT